MFDSFWKYLGYGEDENSSSESKKVTKDSLKPSFEVVTNPTNFYFLSLILEDDGSWSIHGLWPQYNLTKYPRFCKRVLFDLSKLEPIIDDLKSDWYSSRGLDNTFWEHEYLKHGTCNFNNLDEFQYFKTTLNLFNRAIALNLPDKYYNSETNKCLIPVNQQFKFFEIKKD
jgi:hypothetical protein